MTDDDLNAIRTRLADGYYDGDGPGTYHTDDVAALLAEVARLQEDTEVLRAAVENGLDEDTARRLMAPVSEADLIGPVPRP